MEGNAFIKQNTLGAGSNNARTENGAISYATMGTALLDQFAKAGAFRGRDLEAVWADQSKLWSEDPESALKLPFYLRTITRKAKDNNGTSTESVQKGQGAKDESVKRLLWIAKYHPESFYKNLWLVPVVGSWRDLWVMLSMEASSGDKYLDHGKFWQVIAEGMNSEYSKDLVKKYMPRIRSNAKCTTDWAKNTNNLAKEFCHHVGWTYKEYREFKADGVAHDFQKIICSGRYSEIDWNKIPGKALLSLISSKFLDNHKLTESYMAWLEKQPVAKFNGYVYELGHKAMAYNLSTSMATVMTVNKQFKQLVKTAEEGIDGGAIKGNVLCALDTSDSMTWVDFAGVTPLDICLSLGVYFSELNKGAFHNTVAMFSDESRLLQLSGEFVDKLSQIRNERPAMGSTNFQSLIDLLVRTRQQHPEIPLEDYPSTLLIVSDMQFNKSNGYRYNPATGNREELSNYDTAMAKLKMAFPQEFVDSFKIIWWNVAGRHTTDFPSTMEHGGTYMFSGFDGAIISMLLGGDFQEKPNNEAPSMEDIIRMAFDQEVMRLIQL